MSVPLHERDLPAELLAHYRAQDLVAVDLETRGLNPHRDRICLVQLASREQSDLVRIAPDQVRTDADAAPRPAPGGAAPAVPARMVALLGDPRVRKVFHFAPFDVRFLQVQFGAEVANPVCTKVLSRMTRTYSQSHSLRTCLEDVFGMELDKKSQQSDWSGDLTPKQLAYAQKDVLHLIPLYEHFRARLQADGRWPLAEAVCAFLPVYCRLADCGWGRIYEYEES